MKVLHVTASMSATWGGSSRVIADLAATMSRKGVNTSVFAAKGYRVGRDIIETNQLDITLFQTDWFSYFWTGHARGLSDDIRNAVNDCDIVHIHELWHYPHFAAYHAAIQANKPYCITIHGHMNPWALRNKRIRKTLYMRAFQKKSLQNANTIHAMNQEEYQYIRDQGLTNNVRIIPNGVFIEQFSRHPYSTLDPNVYQNGSGDNIILFLGRIHPVKGLELLVKSFSEIIISNPDVHLVIAGPYEKSYKSHLERILAMSGALNNCTFTGMLNEKEKLAWLHRANIFVLPSYSEGMSISTLEAMASKVPVIITNHCQLPDVGSHNAGLIVSTEVSEITKGLRYLIDNPNDRQSMGFNGHQLVKNKYTWDVIGDNYLNMYEDILA